MYIAVNGANIDVNATGRCKVTTRLAQSHSKREFVTINSINS
jgi:hypothetical protein